MRPARVSLAALVAAGFILPAGAALADIAIEDVIRIARENGVAEFRELELDDGRWEVEGRTVDGRRIEVDIAASDGRVIKTERD